MLASGVTALSVLSIGRWAEGSAKIIPPCCSVSQADRGNYTCRPASGGESSISLHVLEGAKQLVTFNIHCFQERSRPDFNMTKQVLVFHFSQLQLVQ
jgi:hypothetical protein